MATTGRAAATDPGDEAVALVVASGGPGVTGPPGALDAGAAALRSRLLEATDDLPGDARGLVPGAAVGDTSRVPADLATAMRTSGLTHVTAVSGAHVAVLGVAVLALTAGLPRPARTAACALVLAGFVLLVRPEPSVVRAAGMGAVALAGLAVGRRSRALPALAATVTVLLVVDPWLARSYGFVLSVVATGAIVLLAPALVRRVPGRVPRWAAVALAVPVAAQAACAPVLVLLDPGVSLYAVPANLAAAPAVAPATLLGLAATLAAPVAPTAAAALARVAAVPSGWIGTVARTAAGLDGARLAWPGGPGGALLLAGVTAAGLVLVLVRRAPRLRALVGGGLALVLLLAVPGATAPLAALAPGGGPPEGWRVVQCDVGQGDALVVRTGTASAVVVDVGPDGPAAGACLDALGVERVDLLVLTHHHADHVGGLPGVLAGRRVERALVSPLPEPAGQARRTVDALEAAGVPVDVGLADAGPGAVGDRDPDGEGRAGDVAWTVLWPVASRVPVAAALDPPADGGGGEEANDASLVVHLRAPGLDVLALGDVEPEAQERLAALLPGAPGEGGGPGTAVDVVKVAHHGSAHQSARLAQALAPSVALVSAGAGNSYGHPARSTVELYRATGALVLTTDRCGAVTVAEEGDRLRVWAGCL
ncbi:ComEC/Rec2 family competence protein [Actinotalea solisilvae]|uniref:ComEC/Rec2 family competence protein n=1 Tax=Actinotalea solisilvae TaxID=2072922 RepID=UPI0027DD90D4|nr:ComEC/Rec2 family competence protein [Actinotalea solisilvae]